MRWLSTLRVLLIRWLNVPVTLTIHRVQIEAEPVQAMDYDAWKKLAMLWHNAPGLQDNLKSEYEARLKRLCDLSPAPEFDRHRLELAAEIRMFRHFLSIPNAAVTEMQKIQDRTRRELAAAEAVPVQGPRDLT